LDHIFSFFSFLTLNHFNTKWPATSFQYQRLSTLAFISVCDFSTNGVVKSMDGYQPNTCGTACLLLKDAFNGDYPQSFEGYSKSDHVHFVALSNGKSVNVRSGSGAGSSISGNIVLSFRGTHVWDLVNMRRNKQMSYMLVSLCMGCAATNGAYKNFIALRNLILLKLVKAEDVVVAKGKETNYPSNPKSLVVGMSMGASLAYFAGIYLRVRVSKQIGAIYTFGGPRVGNAALYTYMKQITTANFAMYRDPVPHQPTRMFGFRAMASDIFHLHVDPVFWGLEAKGEEPPYHKYLSYKQFSGRSSDAEFSGSVSFFDLKDHFLYFLGLAEDALGNCGGLADYFLLNVKGTSLFL